MPDYCCKVGYVIEKYNLTVPGPIADDIDEYLAAQWLGRGEFSSVGHRQLAEWFNKRLLRKIYVEHDRSVTETRIDSEYEALTGDDEPRKQEVLDDLERDGVDGDEVVDDFISRSTMVRHLKNCLELEKEKEQGRERASQRGAGESTWERDKIEYGRQNFREGVEQAVSSLTNKGQLPGGTGAEIDLPVLMSCPECATRVRLSNALQRGYICSDHLGVIEEMDGEPREETGDTDYDRTDSDSIWELVDTFSS